MSCCEHVLTRGKNAGKACGKRRCKLHAKKKDDDGVKTGEAEWAVMHAIVNNLIKAVPHDRQAFRTLSQLRRSSKSMRALVEEHLERLYATALMPGKTEDAAMDAIGLSIPRRVELLTGCGCQRCGTPKITKISWPFPIRVCQPCLREITMSQGQIAWFGVQYHSDVFRMYARNSAKPLFWRYLVEKELGQPLEHFLMNDDKFAVANELQVDYKELLHISIHFRTAHHVIRSVAEAEYYVHLARRLFTDRMGMHNVWLDPIVSPDYIRLHRTIRSKYDYDVLATEFDVRMERYCKLRHLRHLETRTKALMEKHAFFRDMTWRCLKHPSVAACVQMEQDLDVVPTDDTLENACSLCLAHVREVVEEHVEKPAIPDWIQDDPIAVDIVRRLARYPDPLPHLSLFCTAYLFHKGMDRAAVGTLTKSVASWDEAKELVAKCNRPHTCAKCRSANQPDSDKTYSFVDLAVHEQYRHSRRADAKDDGSRSCGASAFHATTAQLMAGLPSFLSESDIHIYEITAKIVRFALGDEKTMTLTQVPGRYRVWVHQCARSLELHSESSTKRRKYLKDVEVTKTR